MCLSVLCAMELWAARSSRKGALGGMAARRGSSGRAALRELAPAVAEPQPDRLGELALATVEPKKWLRGSVRPWRVFFLAFVLTLRSEVH